MTESVYWSNGVHHSKRNVFINNCRKFDVEKTYLRKRKDTDFFAPMAAEEYLRKRKATDFFSPMAAEEIVHESEPDVRLICADGQVNNIFFNQDNISKQCAQGAIANLLNMLQCSKEELEIFWHLANSDEHVIEKQLREQVPTKVKKFI